MTTELPSGLRLYRSELRDAIERDLDRKARRRRVLSRGLRLAVPPWRNSSPGRWRGWAIVGTVAAAIAVAGTLVFSGGTAAVSAQTLAHRTIKSLNAASGDFMEYAHTTMINPSGQVTRSNEMWDFGRSRRVESFDANGSPIIDASSISGNGSNSTVIVDYAKQTWWQSDGGPFLGSPGPQVASTIEQGLQNGDLTIVGNAIVNGQQTIELSAAAASSPGTSYDIWIDPTTYLPVQATDTSSAATAQVEFEWLQATQSNLALLSPPIPSGFTQLPVPNGASSSGAGGS